MLIAPKRLKLQTSRDMRVFRDSPDTILKMFRKGSICKNSLGRDMHSYERLLVIIINIFFKALSSKGSRGLKIKFKKTYIIIIIIIITITIIVVFSMQKHWVNMSKKNRTTYEYGQVSLDMQLTQRLLSTALCCRNTGRRSTNLMPLVHFLLLCLRKKEKFKLSVVVAREQFVIFQCSVTFLCSHTDIRPVKNTYTSTR